MLVTNPPAMAIGVDWPITTMVLQWVAFMMQPTMPLLPFMMPSAFFYHLKNGLLPNHSFPNTPLTEPLGRMVWRVPVRTVPGRSEAGIAAMADAVEGPARRSPGIVNPAHHILADAEISLF